MRTNLTAFSGILAAALAAFAGDAPTGRERSEDAAAIRDSASAFADAFNKGDARAIAELFTEGAEAVDEEGDVIEGRPALEDHYAGRFEEGTGQRLVVHVDDVHTVAPGIVRSAGRTEIVIAEGTPPITGQYTAIHVKDAGRWKLASLREIPETQVSHQERLRELEWLVGDWVEEEEGAVVLTSVAWSDDKHYLLRTFDVRVKGKPALTGTQRIGWDPLTRQIKSWVFDSQGGYGDALWMRSGNQWVIKSNGVRPDGRTTTATQVLTYVKKDTLRWKSIDRTLGDEIAEDIDEIVMVRQPPKPK